VLACRFELGRSTSPRFTAKLSKPRCPPGGALPFWRALSQPFRESEPFREVTLRARESRECHGDRLADLLGRVGQRLPSFRQRASIAYRERGGNIGAMGRQKRGTTSIFAYSLEINGAASMGAGALEAPTTKLRDYPVLDVTKITASGFFRGCAMEEGISEAELKHQSPVPASTAWPFTYGGRLHAG
jgi:hypothetical protein